MAIRTVRIELTVLGHPVAVEHGTPDGRARVDELLPLLYALDNAVIGAAVKKIEAEGKAVSCCKGCSACCRAQPVPVTPAEAFALARLVDALPEPRRTEVRERFADRVAKLKDAGLFDLFLRLVPVTDKQQARDAATAYFRLGLVCPFLKDDACSIHPDRPFVCRQYLVTSPAELCADPLANPVAVVPIPFGPAGALLRAAEPVAGRPQLTVPLVLALEYAARHRDELERTTEAEPLLNRWLAELGISR
ncbi:MAG TPA: YkgJ family cysteine cluster protein [Gemmataceae bacterium]|nr:YkgJ family cysteine cluster protein [Gemmataceae bacterium]